MEIPPDDRRIAFPNESMNSLTTPGDDSPLIPINRASGKPSVNARDLYAFLEVGKDFSTWIKDRIEQFGFSEGSDFSPISGESTGGRPSKEYTLSLDMAKELSMVERNDKGKQARQYFIECERVLREQPQRIPTHSEALRLAADALELVDEQKQQLALVAPKVEAYDRLEEADGSLTITDSAKVLQIKPGELFNYLQVATWIYKRPMCSAFVAFQKRLDQGWLTEKTKPVALADGTVRITAQVRITPTGITKLAKIINASRPLAFHSPTTLP